MKSNITRLIEIASQLDNDTRPATDVMFGRLTHEVSTLCIQYNCTWTEEQHAIINRLLYWLTNILTRPDDLQSQTHRAGHSPAQHIAEVIQCLTALMRTANTQFVLSPADEAALKSMAETLKPYKGEDKLNTVMTP